MTETFDADWLTLREPRDARARSRALAARLIAALPARPRLLDLGAGTGSLFRWLAPRIGRAQAWTLVDADPAMAEEAFGEIAAWALEQSFDVTWPSKRTLLLHTPGGAWRVETLTLDLAAAPARLPLDRADAVVSSALCDLVSVDWVARMAAALRVPFYAALCVDGRDRFHPPHRADALVGAAFRRDQGRDKGFGPALGPRAPAAIARAFAARGATVEQAASDWVLPPDWAAQELVGQLLIGHAEAATRMAPARRQAVRQWMVARVAEPRLRVRIGHRDILALPGKGGR